MRKIERISLADKKMYSHFLCVVISIITVLSVWNFVKTPIVSDLRVFLSGANQANYISSNPILGSYKQWELKGCLNRLVIYLLYKAATQVSKFPSYNFGIICNIIYLSATFIIILLSVKLISDVHDRYKNLVFVELIFLSLVMTWVECHVQAEMSGIVVLILAFSLYFNVAKDGLTLSKMAVFKLLIAGMLIGSIFYFKSVMILMSVSVVAGICLLLSDKNSFSFRRLCIVVLGSVIGLGFNSILLLEINPGEFQDMLDASVFQRTLLSSNQSFIYAVKRFVVSYVRYGILIPVLGIGLICFLLNIIYYIKIKNYLKVLFGGILWMMPFLFVILSNKYFVYHYLVFVFPCIIEGLVLFKRKLKRDIIIFWFLFVVACVGYQMEMGIFTQTIQNYIAIDKETYTYNEEFFSLADIDREAVCMYLDDGIGSYYMGNKSYLKYYFPLPLQRLNDSMGIKCRLQTFEQAMSYKGRYICIYDGWFFGTGYNDEIREKINLEYRYIGSFKRYAPPSIFSKSIETQSYDLYEKMD